MGADVKYAGGMCVCKKLQDVNAKDYDERTALHIAAANGQMPMVKMLMEFKANVNAKDRWGSTPMDDALAGNHSEVASLLREKGGVQGAGWFSFWRASSPSTSLVHKHTIRFGWAENIKERNINRIDFFPPRMLSGTVRAPLGNVVKQVRLLLANWNCWRIVTLKNNVAH